MLNITEELEKMKSSLWGYDKESVQLLIKELLESCEQEAEHEHTRLLDQNRQLQAKLQETKERLKFVTQQFETLMEKLDKMTAALEQETEYSRERDKELEAFHKKEEELNALHTKALEEAKAAKKQLLADVDHDKESLIEEGKKEYNRLVAQGREEQEQLLEEGRNYKKMIIKRYETMEGILKKLKEELYPAICLGDDLSAEKEKLEIDDVIDYAKEPGEKT